MANLVLVGMMGSGKSTLAKIISRDLGLEVIDTDASIEQNEHMLIKDIFSKLGEPYFRQLESQFLVDLNKDKIILSTGGGMILSQGNRLRLKDIGCVIYLNGSVQTLMDRLSTETENRPLLSKDQLEKQLLGLLCERHDLYLEASHASVTIDNKSTDQICSEIYTILRELGYKF